MRLGAAIILALLIIGGLMAASKAFTGNDDDRLSGNVEDIIQQRYDQIGSDAFGSLQAEAQTASTSTGQ